jgi:hypothetical protein
VAAKEESANLLTFVVPYQKETLLPVMLILFVDAQNLSHEWRFNITKVKTETGVMSILSDPHACLEWEVLLSSLLRFIFFA